ncbi:hypothetical protein BDK51DRAFT_29173 [Blyttiomyces helicus]|uniref:PHD-type domain-containing protein n=1 Tax=Blyttiomyces helicus TaxID=388810 RepID=A0A4P9WPG2_9FUNG|nr:hypothetical protein BDK51DRAFT_29173 [Blyttiomyces helicus]|eukprot:RKO93628.1 hypothetical protein BDK51DRAFT_29173 [Blyttiomyces helicus]
MHCTCAANYGLLEEDNDENMSDPFFVYCKEHASSDSHRLNPWAQWVQSKYALLQNLETSHPATSDPTNASQPDPRAIFEDAWATNEGAQREAIKQFTHDICRLAAEHHELDATTFRAHEDIYRIETERSALDADLAVVDADTEELRRNLLVLLHSLPGMGGGAVGGDELITIAEALIRTQDHTFAAGCAGAFLAAYRDSMNLAEPPPAPAPAPRTKRAHIPRPVRRGTATPRKSMRRPRAATPFSWPGEAITSPPPPPPGARAAGTSRRPSPSSPPPGARTPGPTRPPSPSLPQPRRRTPSRPPPPQPRGRTPSRPPPSRARSRTPGPIQPPPPPTAPSRGHTPALTLPPLPPSSVPSVICNICKMFEGPAPAAEAGGPDAPPRPEYADPKFAKNAKKLIECAECHNVYHWGCLDPPLKSPPDVGYTWRYGLVVICVATGAWVGGWILA